MPAITDIFNEASYPGAVASVTLTNISRGGSVIVAGPVTMDQGPPGTFTYPPPGDADGMVYSYTRTVTFINGQTITQNLTSLSASAVSTFTNEMAMRMDLGRINADAASDTNATNLPNVQRYQYAGDQADLIVGRKFRSMRYNLSAFTSASADWGIVCRVATQIGVGILEFPRVQLEPKRDGPSSAYVSRQRRAEMDLYGMLAAGIDCPRVAAYSVLPADVAPTGAAACRIRANDQPFSFRHGWGWGYW